ncbi:hypothetical protein WKV44_03360 [Spirochaetia bacterium 38H-sp]|uniref:Uncharacterized protein n=1 Tax=Rarispira pelagica TaxID=3141764 RepID=A0ABU9UA87_9SPIR
MIVNTANITEKTTAIFYLKPVKTNLEQSIQAIDNIYASKSYLLTVLFIAIIVALIFTIVFILIKKKSPIKKNLEIISSMRAGISIKLPRDYARRMLFAIQQAESSGETGRLVYVLSPGCFAQIKASVCIDNATGRQTVFSDTRIMHVHPLAEEKTEKSIITTIAIDYSRKYRTDYTEEQESVYSFESARTIWKIYRSANITFENPLKDPLCPYCKTPLPEEADSPLCTYCEKDLSTGDTAPILYDIQSPLTTAIKTVLDTKLGKTEAKDIETEDNIKALILSAIFPEANINTKKTIMTMEAREEITRLIRAGNLFPFHFNINYTKTLPIKEEGRISLLVGITLTRALIKEDLFDIVDPVPITRHYILEGHQEHNNTIIESIISLTQQEKNPYYKKIRNIIDNMLSSEEKASLIISSILLTQQISIPEISESMESLIQKTRTTTLIRHSLPYIARGKQGILLPASKTAKNKLRTQLEKFSSYLKKTTIENTYLEYFKEILTE